MASDLQVIAPKLVRSGLWSGRDNLCRFKHVVLDADSIAAHLYRLCVSDQVRRQRSIISTNQVADLYGASIVNYADYCRRIEQLFRFMADHSIEPIVVYSGINYETSLYGSVAGATASSNQRVQYRLSSLINYDRERATDSQPNLPPLALNMFKMVVNSSSRSSKHHCSSHQAYYSSFPLMTKLARDFRCPVLTNEYDFLLMDVRAGFILFDNFWLHHIELHNLATTAIMSREQNSIIKLDKASGPVATMNVACTFHYNALFLRQHPGLTPQTAVYLFPLTSVDFVTTYAAKLKKIRLYDSHYNRQDFLARPLVSDQSAKWSNTKSPIYQRYHKAAKRLELALNYLCGKDSIVLENFVNKGTDPAVVRPSQTATGFGADFRCLVAKQAVAHNFTKRLQFVTKRLAKQDAQADYIRECLTRRECSASYLVELIHCSVGRMTCRSHNQWLSFEDLKTKRSAHSVGNRAKSMLMSLLNPPPNPPSSSSRLSATKPSALISVDREGSAMAEFRVDSGSDCKGAHLDALRDSLQLGRLAKQESANDQALRVAAATKFINQAFMSADLRQLPKAMEDLVGDQFGLSKELKLELAVVRSAFKFCTQKACAEDSYFGRAYSRLVQDFELALVNHYIYVNQRMAPSKKNPSTEQLVALVNRRDLENVAHLVVGSDETGSSSSSSSKSAPQLQSSPKSSSKQSSSSSTKTSGSSAAKLSRRTLTKSISTTTPTTKTTPPKSSRMIRHLIEMLNVALATYLELNALFGYPLPRLQALTRHYNPVLLYNLSLLAEDKALIRL